MTEIDGSKAPPSGESGARWPGVLGGVGVVLGLLMFLDKLDDLFVTAVVPMRELSRLIGPDATELIVRASTPGWRLVTFLVTGTLGILLLVGSLRLSRRDPSGVRTCRVWAVLAMAWAVVETIRAVIVLRELTASVPVIHGVDWTAYAAIGVFGSLVLMLAYPVFLSVWFSRPSVRAEYSAWPGAAAATSE